MNGMHIGSDRFQDQVYSIYITYDINAEAFAGLIIVITLVAIQTHILSNSGTKILHYFSLCNHHHCS